MCFNSPAFYEWVLTIDRAAMSLFSVLTAGVEGESSWAGGGAVRDMPRKGSLMFRSSVCRKASRSSSVNCCVCGKIESHNTAQDVGARNSPFITILSTKLLMFELLLPGVNYSALYIFLAYISHHDYESFFSADDLIEMYAGVPNWSQRAVNLVV